ncbi:acyl-CoA thioesterase II [Kaistia sp. 32K]|uniref:acyl-CoA thioesterase II n=1 Tax=Kaistia sp. 32K TaxID=2795690 RepID=UPI0019165D8E|nr:acyl-CoA thioesterase II [Kaistia sp. 32K]BCP55765.1 acyl-CoA thioesterase II [Kaistia sp. 32K]
MIDDLLSILDLEPLEHNLFRGRSFDPGWQRVFGGQVIGQSLVAASRTVEADRPVHSMHCYFLRLGDPAAPIVYEVERVRDGGSFSTRRVVAIQHGRTIFVMSASFHIREEGFDHQIAMPDVPPPEDLPVDGPQTAALLDGAPEGVRRYWERLRPIELRPVDLEGYFTRAEPRLGHAIWLRAKTSIGDDPVLNSCVLAYASDLTLLDTTLLAHGRSAFDPSVQVASLDHAIWFHRPFRMDDWLLYVEDSPSAFGARGFNRGSLFDRRGVLVASVAQEGLVRPVEPSAHNSLALTRPSKPNN